MGNHGAFLTGRLTTEDIKNSKRVCTPREQKVREIEKAVNANNEYFNKYPIKNQTITLYGTLKTLKAKVEEMIAEDMTVLSVILLPNAMSADDFIGMSYVNDEDVDNREIVVVYNLSPRKPKVLYEEMEYTAILAGVICDNLTPGTYIQIQGVGEVEFHKGDVLVAKGSKEDMLKFVCDISSGEYSQHLIEVHLTGLYDNSYIVMIRVKSLREFIHTMLLSCGDVIREVDFVEHNLGISWDMLARMGIVTR